MLGTQTRIFYVLCIVLPLAAWAPTPLSPPVPGYWRRCRSSAPHHLEKGGLGGGLDQRGIKYFAIQLFF